VNATDPRNQQAITTAVPLFLCPSTPGGSGGNRIAQSLWIGKGEFDATMAAATTDYNATEGLTDGSRCWLSGWGAPELKTVPWAPPHIPTVSFEDYTDGLSNTALLVERAGLPDHYWDAGARHERHAPPAGTWGNVGLWAISAEQFLNHLDVLPNLRPINRDNLKTMFSFHPGGALAAMGDGSVLFWDETMDNPTFVAFMTRDLGECVNREYCR
ncbi:MAG: DUF1559 domain-containing protein, partial [Planctomycetota bacterium]